MATPRPPVVIAATALGLSLASSIGIWLSSETGQTAADGTGERPPWTRPTYSEPASEDDQSRVGPVITSFPGFLAPAEDAWQVVRESSFIGTVEVLARLEDYWPSSAAELFAYSVWRVRVVDLVAGDFEPGDEFDVIVPGGTEARTGDPGPGGSMRPVAGEPTVENRYREFPPYVPGTIEFIAAQEWRPEGRPFLIARWDERYRTDSGTLASVQNQSSGIGQGGPTGVFDGLTLDEVRMLVVSQKP